MVDWLVAATLRFFETNDSGSGGPSSLIDLLDLQWWQLLLAIVTTLGFSPAPWLLGIAFNRVQFTKTADAAHERELNEVKAAHERELAARDAGWLREKTQMESHQAFVLASMEQRYADLEVANHKNIEAAELQRQRADEATSALAQSTEVLQMTNHILQELKRSAEEASPNG